MHGVLLRRHLRQDELLAGSTSHFIWMRQNTRRECHQDIATFCRRQLTRSSQQRVKGVYYVVLTASLGGLGPQDRSMFAAHYPGSSRHVTGPDDKKGGESGRETMFTVLGD